MVGGTRRSIESTARGTRYAARVGVRTRSACRRLAGLRTSPVANTTIALLTDFGTRDPYVAVMKGVIASRTDARVEDLSHDIASFNPFEAAWFLRTVAPWWPDGTIFVCVIDPGVGTARRILCAAANGQLF